MALTPLKKATAEKALTNRRCVIIGGDANDKSYFQCGKRIIARDNSTGRYYRMTGKDALSWSYQLKARNRGYYKPLTAEMRRAAADAPWRPRRRRRRR